MSNKLSAVLIAIGVMLVLGCKREEAVVAVSESTNSPDNRHMPTAPTASAATPVNIASDPSGDINATLAQLTRELHRSMIGAKKLPASYEEFAANRNLHVPLPPAGKKYAISKQWRVVLVDAK
jgi:hypothetical protein